jgi:hypothetical protein
VVDQSVFYEKSVQKQAIDLELQKAKDRGWILDVHQSVGLANVLFALMMLCMSAILVQIGVKKPWTMV